MGKKERKESKAAPAKAVASGEKMRKIMADIADLVNPNPQGTSPVKGGKGGGGMSK